MIKYFCQLQSGLLDPKKFNQIEITKRCRSFQLSRHQDVESVHTSGINTLDIEKSENRYLLSGCADGSIYIHDVNNSTGRFHYTAKCICKVSRSTDYTQRYSVECVSWYGNDNCLFITSGTDKVIKIWDANCLKSIENFNSKGRVFHHDCSLVPTSSPLIAVASSINIVELIDLRTGGSMQELRSHKSSVLSCSWSPREEYLLATGGLDKSILLWDIRSSNSCLKTLDKNNKFDKNATAHSGYVNGLKFTSDGLNLVSSGTDNKIRIWETLNGHNQGKNAVDIKNEVKKNVQFAISNSSRPPLLYIPSRGNIFILEMPSCRLIKILNGHFHLVNCSFYRDAYQELYSGGNDRNILLWTAHEPLEAPNESDEPVQHLSAEDAWTSEED